TAAARSGRAAVGAGRRHGRAAVAAMGDRDGHGRRARAGVGVAQAIDTACQARRPVAAHRASAHRLARRRRRDRVRDAGTGGDHRASDRHRRRVRSLVDATTSGRRDRDGHRRRLRANGRQRRSDRRQPRRRIDAVRGERTDRRGDHRRRARHFVRADHRGRRSGAGDPRRTPRDARRLCAVTRRLAATAAVVCLSMLLLQMWLITHRNLDIDELEHAHAAWSFAHGLMPYRDFFEHHTPWIYFAAAPTLASARVATNTDAALGWFVDARLVMLAITVAVMALVYVHARLGGDTWSGLIAVTLLVTSAQFMDRILDFRPDVPALGCGMASLLLARIGWRSESRRVPLLAWLASGAMLGAAVMFTQKCLFVLPGFGLALLIDVARASSHQRIVRLWRVVVFGVGVVAPIALTVAWFARHDALIPFLHYNLAENLRLNQQRFSPLPRALAHVLHSPALAIPGLLGLIGETRM